MRHCRTYLKSIVGHILTARERALLLGVQKMILEKNFIVNSQ